MRIERIRTSFRRNQTEQMCTAHKIQSSVHSQLDSSLSYCIHNENVFFFSFFHKKKKHWTGKNCMQTLLKCWNWCQFLITRKFVGMLDSYSLSFCLFSISIQFISFQRFAICTAFTVGELNWKFCCHSDNESI